MARRYLETIRRERELGYHLVGYVAAEHEKPGRS